MEKKKKHADFQDEYTRSSNFNNTTDPDPLKPLGDGTVKISDEDEDRSDKEEINKTIKSLTGEEEQSGLISNSCAVNNSMDSMIYVKESIMGLLQLIKNDVQENVWIFKEAGAISAYR